MDILTLKDSITSFESLSRQNVNHADTLIANISSGTNTITVLGIPENIARILIPAIVSILVVLLSLSFSWYLKKRDKKLEMQSYRDIILRCIELIDLPVNKQIESCREFADTLKKSKNIHPERFIYSKILAGKVDSIGIDRFINTFIINSTHPIENENSKMTFNLVSQFSFLAAVELELCKVYNVYQEQIISFMDEWNEYFFKLNDLISSYSRIINDDKKNPMYDFHRALINLSNIWMRPVSGQEITTEYTINYFFNPLSGLVESELSGNNNNEYAFEISSVLQKIRILEKKWKTNIGGNAKLFDEYSESISKSYNALINARDYFNNKTKVSNIWRIK